MLEQLQIFDGDYENALSILDDTGFQIHLKQLPDSSFVTNYFRCGLEYSKYSCQFSIIIKESLCMCTYLSRTEDKRSRAISQAVKDSVEVNYNNHEQMRLTARAYTSKRKCSRKETVYHIMPELWLRKVFPSVVLSLFRCINNV